MQHTRVLTEFDIFTLKLSMYIKITSDYRSVLCSHLLNVHIYFFLKTQSEKNIIRRSF